MNRGFSLRRHRSQPVKKSNRESFVVSAENGVVQPSDAKVTRSFSTKILRRFNSRRKSRPLSFISTKSFGNRQTRESTILSPIDDEEKLNEKELPDRPKRTQSRRERFSFVLANPDTLFATQHKNASDTQLHMNRPDKTESSGTQSVILRTLFSPKVDFAPTSSVVYRSTIKKPESPKVEKKQELDPDQYIFDEKLISENVLNNMPNGYMMRPLVRADYGRGFLEVLRVSGKVGYISNKRWDERCEYLKERAERGEEYVIVVVDEKPDRVVGIGRWTAEKGFTNNLGTSGKIQDISVARDQKGRKIGLRILEALVQISVQAGCYKTIVNCSEANEPFHSQVGFKLEGSMMVMNHMHVQRKVIASKEL